MRIGEKSQIPLPVWILLTIFGLVCVAGPAHARDRSFRTTFTLEFDQLRSPQSTSASRELLRTTLNDNITSAFTGEITSSTKSIWGRALWGTELFGLDNELTRKGIKKGLRQYRKIDGNLLRNLIETAYATDRRSFKQEISTAARHTTSPKIFAMGAMYQARAARESAFDRTRRRLREQMERNFPKWEDDPILTFLNFDLTKGRFSRSETEDLYKAPSLVPLLRADFATSFPVIFSFQRRNRNFEGLTVVRKPNGKFLRNEDSTIFCIPHLALSFSNLPGYITYGNTPQGIFTIRGLDVTKNKYIGQTPFIETAVPNEVSPPDFFHDKSLKGTSWTIEMYRDFLPETTSSTSGKKYPKDWKHFFPFYEAWYAGKAGRSQMLSHGTTVDPENYLGEDWYPNTPTIGCICAKEIWDPDSGKALMSDQLALVKAYIRASGKKVPKAPGTGPFGYFVLVEIDNKQRPVMLDDVLIPMLTAEKNAGEPK
jgi:hypothetical protein